jgi:hypothetical protein
MPFTENEMFARFGVTQSACGLNLANFCWYEANADSATFFARS